MYDLNTVFVFSSCFVFMSCYESTFMSPSYCCDNSVFVMNGLAHRYHLGEATFILRGIRGGFKFLLTFSMNFL